MQIGIDTNCRDVARQLKRIAESAPRVTRKATIDAMTVLYAGSRGLLSSLIHARAILKVLRRKRSGGKLGRARMVALWKRTSQLLRGEKQHLESGTDGTVTGTIDNATPYALYRHENTRRPAPWRREAVAQYGPTAKEAFRSAIAALSN